MSKKESIKHFTSHWGFILSAVGSAVGMANVWGFPAKMGANGGGAFIVAYLLFVIMFSIIGLAAEYTIGRRAKTGTLGAYHHAWATRSEKWGRVGAVIGWLPLMGSMCIAVGYAVIISYILKALVSSVTGSLMTVDTLQWFSSFSTIPYSVIPYHIIVVIFTLFTILLGPESIEKTNKLIMPIFFVIFIILAIRVGFLEGAVHGYQFMLHPEWSQLADPMVWIWAMGQAFFSLSVTGSGMIVYGAYLKDEVDVVSTAKETALFDTLAALVAALVIIPACFAYQLDIGAGPSLLFVTLPRILQDIPFGQLFAIILYLAMIFAGISSLQNMFEAVAESLLFRFPRLHRKSVLAILCVICLGAGINMEAIYQWGPWMDIVSIYIIPLGAALGAISWFWVMKPEELLDGINSGITSREKQHGRLWLNLGRYVYVPCTLILCAVALFMHVAF